VAELTVEQQQALARARARARAAQGQAAAAQPAASEGPSEPFQRAGLAGGSPMVAGLGDSAIKAYLGVKQLIPGVGLNENDQLALKGMAQEREEDPEKGWRTGGEVLGNVAMTAIPAHHLTKAIQGSRLAAAVGKAAPYLATAGAAGGTEFVTSVGTGADQLEQVGDKLINAAKAAVIAPVLQKTLGGLGRLIAQPFKAKADAAKLFEQGVNPTLQQGAETGWGRFVGGLASGSSKVRDRQEAEVLDAVTRRATEGQRSAMGGTGAEHLRTAQGYVEDIYSGLIDGKRFNLSPSVRQRMAQAAGEVNKQGQFLREAAEAGAEVGNVMGNSATNMRIGGERLRKQMLTPLADAREAASNAVARDRIGAARDILKEEVLLKGLNPQERARHAQADVLNFDVSRLREAVGKMGEDEGVTLSRLANAYGGMTNQARSIGNKTEEELIGPALRVLGRTPTQDEARALKVTLQRLAAPGALAAAGTVAPKLAAVGAPFYGISLAGQTVGGAKALLGQTEAQKRFAEMLRRYAESGRTGAVMGATAFPGEE